MILVTGGTGMVGSHILLELLKNHSHVRALKRCDSNLNIIQKTFSYYKKEKLLKNIEWIDGDILDIPSLYDAIDGCKFVYHAAALVSFHKKEHKDLFKINVEGTANIVNVCLDKKIEKLAYVSSIATLNRYNVNGLINEENYWKPNKKNSVYSISKYLAEQEVWRGTQEGLNNVIINPSVILGPGNWNNGSSKIFQQSYDGLKYYTNGVTGYVDVVDVAKSLIYLMDSKIINERFIINCENFTYQDIFNWIADEMKKPRPHIKVTPFLKEFAWRAEAVRSFFSRKKPLLTKETANQAMSKSFYSNEKIKSQGYEFQDIKSSIKKYSNWFLSECH